MVILLDLQNKAYYWPDRDERKVMAKLFYDDLKVPNVVAVGDGIVPTSLTTQMF